MQSNSVQKKRRLGGSALALFATFSLFQVQACSQPEPAFERSLRFNAGGASLFDSQRIDSLLAAEQSLGTARRIGLWARRFLADPESRYLFGLKAGGYVTEGLIVSDHDQDCVSLLYRSTELARARSAEDAIRVALATRFSGAPLDSLVDDRGRVDYDRPEHLDYSLDMIRSGFWGKDITGELSGAHLDAEGSSRYAAGSFLYLPQDAFDAKELREGDIAWLVLNPSHESARRLRDEHGPVIGHIGLLIEEEGRILLVHAASSGLEGIYEGGRVEAVPLSTYLERVDRFCGLMVTRFD